MDLILQQQVFHELSLICNIVLQFRTTLRQVVKKDCENVKCSYERRMYYCAIILIKKCYNIILWFLSEIRNKTKIAYQMMCSKTRRNK